MKKEIENAEREFAEFVSSNQEERINGTWSLVRMFTSSNGEDPEKFYYDLGFKMALGWIGELLDIDLSGLTSEEKKTVDKIIGILYKN